MNNIIWDYIIIGTGMGAGPIGLKLSQAGFSVLFLEKGHSVAQKDSLKGQYAELFIPKVMNKKFVRLDILKRAGRRSEDIIDRTGSKRKIITPFIGSGVGGSSALYGMVLERFTALDFQNWPISYSDFIKYYDEAEALFRLRRPREYRHPANEKLSYFLSEKGLNPYILPLANDDVPDCKTCQSYLCDKKCKNDSFRICIEPAITKWGATLLSGHRVEKILTAQGLVTGVQCLDSTAQCVEFKSKYVIVSAGALETPRLLLNSKSPEWPTGIGNHSALVGRYLMRHFVDLYSLKIDNDAQNPSIKEIGIGDFYHFEGRKLGVVQSFERLPYADVILDQMNHYCKNNFGTLFSFLIRNLFPALRVVLNHLRSRRLILCSLLEDTPQFENRVWVEGQNLCLSYKISKEDIKNIEWMRKRLKNLFKTLSPVVITAAEKNEMLAHVCGTCRMGSRADQGVVNTENQVYGIENLFIVDSSFFPTSGGTNPALTIAANSLRVSEILIRRQNQREMSH